MNTINIIILATLLIISLVIIIIIYRKSEKFQFTNPINLQPQKLIDYILEHRELNTIKKGTLTVSSYANFYPVCYIDEITREISGIDVDIMKKFAQKSGLNLNFVIVDHFNDIWFDPPNGKSDVSIGGIGVTSERTTSLTSWTIPYFYVGRTFVYNKNDPVYSFPEGVNRTIKGTVGSTGWIDAVYRLSSVDKTHYLEPGKTDEEDISDLLSGKIQGFVRGSFVGTALTSVYSQLGMVTPWQIDPSLVSPDGECFSYPCNIKSGLSTTLSTFITNLIMNGELKELISKYHLDTISELKRNKKIRISYNL